MAATPPPVPVSWFSSRRERRLWIYTLVIVMGIYATLGLAPILAKAAGDESVALVVLGCMFLIALTVLTQGLRARPAGVEVGVGLGIAAVYLMMFARMTTPERSHLMEYSVVAVFVYEALAERRLQGWRVPVPAVLAILATAFVGGLDECIQAILPSRVFDLRDILFDFLAAVGAVGGMVVLGWVRRR
jgi:hypothetical protein